jgi:hypothetical protein
MRGVEGAVFRAVKVKKIGHFLPLFGMRPMVMPD